MRVGAGDRVLGGSHIAGVVLAGGRSSRMQSHNKLRCEIQGLTLLERAITRIEGQISDLVISGNHDPQDRVVRGHVVVEDSLPDFAGPLAGVLAAMEHFARKGDTRWLISVAADTPLFPLDLVARLYAERQAEGEQIMIAQSGTRAHRVFALWPMSLMPALREALLTRGLRKVALFQQQYPCKDVSWPIAAFDPFFNVNTMQDLELAHVLCQRAGEMA